MLHRSGSSSGTGGTMDGAAGGGNTGCDVVAAVFGLASGVCSVVNLLLPIPHDRAPQVSAVVLAAASFVARTHIPLYLLKSAIGLSRNVPFPAAVLPRAAAMAARLLLRLAVRRCCSSAAHQHVLQRACFNHLAAARQVRCAVNCRFLHVITLL